jgi:hypothetical protein
MLPGEVYIRQDGSVYKKNPFRRNSMFFTFQRLSQQEINQLTDPLNNTKIKSQGGSTGDQATEPTIGIGARTNAENAISGDDYLH